MSDRLANLINFHTIFNGTPTYLGTITTADGVTAKDNTSTAVTFPLAGGWLVELATDVACVVSFGSTATATNGFPLAAGEKRKVFLKLEPAVSTISVLGSAACNVKVFRLS